MPKRKTKCRKDLKYFTQNDIFDSFFFKKERKTQRHFSILNKKAFDTSNMNKSNQIHEEKFNRLSREGIIHDTSLFNTK